MATQAESPSEMKGWRRRQYAHRSPLGLKRAPVARHDQRPPAAPGSMTRSSPSLDGEQDGRDVESNAGERVGSAVVQVPFGVETVGGASCRPGWVLASVRSRPGRESTTAAGRGEPSSADSLSRGGVSSARLRRGKGTHMAGGCSKTKRNVRRRRRLERRRRELAARLAYQETHRTPPVVGSEKVVQGR